MIILDTHIWIWWIDGAGQLPPQYSTIIQSELPHGVGICAISCWEIAKLVERGRLQFSVSTLDWLKLALQPPCVLLPLTPEIAIESTQLPGTFHRDPADQMIVATARHYDCPLVTLDRMILAYPHVKLLP